MKKSFSLLIIVFLVFTIFSAAFAETIAVSQTIGTVKVSNNLKVRSQPNFNSTIVGTLNNGTQVQVLSPIENGWYKISYNGSEAYIRANYLVISQNTSTDSSKQLLGSFSVTSQDKTNDNRNFNMARASSTINGLILEPGQQFVWSKVVGNANKDAGYKLANVMVAGGKLVPGYGGGVCQVVTTTLNALYAASMKPDAATPHSSKPKYAVGIPDATVSFGSIDFKFTNTNNYKIMIEAFTDASTTNVSIYKVN